MRINTTRWNRLRYGFLAPVYDLGISPLEWIGFRAARRDAIAGLDPEPGSRLLIVGGGTGLDLEHLPDGIEVVVTDLVPEMARRAAERAASLGIETDALAMDGERLGFADATFDHALLHLILAVMPDPDACIQEVHRVLKPGGTISIFDKFVADDSEPSLVRRGLNVVANVVATDLTRKLGPLLDAGGFETVEREERIGGLFTLARARRGGAETAD